MLLSSCSDISSRIPQQEAKQAKAESAYTGKMVEDISKRLAQAEHFVRQARRVQMSSALRDLLNPDEPSTWIEDLPLPVLVSTAVQVDITESHDIHRATDDQTEFMAQQQQQGVPGRPASRNAGREPRRSSPLATAALVSAARVKFTGSVSRYRNEQASSGAAAASSAGPLRQFSEDSTYASNQPSRMQSRNSSRQISRRQSMVHQDMADQDTDEADMLVANEASSVPREAPTQSSQAHWQGQALPAALVTSQPNKSLVRQVAERCAAGPAGISFLQQSYDLSGSIPAAANQTATIVIPGRIAQPAGGPGDALTEAAQQDPADAAPDSAAVLQALRDVVASRHTSSSAWPQSRQEPRMYIAPLPLPLHPQPDQTGATPPAMENEGDSQLQPRSESRVSKTSPIHHGGTLLLHKTGRPRSGPQLSSSEATAAAAMPGPLQFAADVLTVDDGSRPSSWPGTRGSSRPHTAGKPHVVRATRPRSPAPPDCDLSSDGVLAGFATLEEGEPFSRSASGGKHDAVVSPQTANKFQPSPARQKPSSLTSRSKQAS